MVILVDGDIFVYRAAFGAQQQYYKSVLYDDMGEVIDSISHPVGVRKADIKIEDYYELELAYEAEDVTHAIYNVKSMLKSLRAECEAHFKTACILKLFITADDKSNFRYDIAKSRPYKGNRTQPKPIHYQACRDYLIKVNQAKVVGGQEADDELGILMARNPGKTCVASIDKDLLMIPGIHYNFVKKEFTEVSKYKGMWTFYAQVLKGDTVDNIPGLPGYGESRASKILLPPKMSMSWTLDDMLDNVLKAYDDEEYFLEQARLVWIRRQRDELIDIDTLRRYNAEAL